ncbi:MAG: hypothetical protein FWF92_08440 [Oscillospiraceae bacterium]|nr:hypothetical protein [Oscillospiraceae bacterium]
MKKILALVIVLAMMFALAIPVMAADMITLPTAPKAEIVIDGVLDDGYGEFYNLNSYRDDSMDGATGRYASAWNEKGLYYYVEVYDTTPNHNHDNTYQRDRVEFFIDWNSAKEDSHSGSDNPYWQTCIASAPNDDGFQLEPTGNYQDFTDDSEGEGIIYVVKPLEGSDLSKGYIIEVFLPIALTGGAAKALVEGGSVLVDFQIGDNQYDEGRSSQVFLAGDDDDVDNQWQYPNACRGILPLGAAKAPAVVDEPEPAPDVVDDTPAPAAPAAPAPAAPTGDSAIMLIVLVIALAGAVIVTKRVSKNKA